MSCRGYAARFLGSKYRSAAGTTPQAYRRFNRLPKWPPIYKTRDFVRTPPVGPITIATISRKRCITTSSSNPTRQTEKEYTFDHILHMVENPTSSRLLIDVREPYEFQTQSIPTAVNIPVDSQPDALLLDGEDFRDRFGFAKPPLDHELVFFCKAGVRSRTSAEIARGAGYTNVAEYPGSWLDWEKNRGPTSKDPAFDQ